MRTKSLESMRTNSYDAWSMLWIGTAHARHRQVLVLIRYAWTCGAKTLSPYTYNDILITPAKTPSTACTTLIRMDLWRKNSITVHILIAPALISPGTQWGCHHMPRLHWSGRMLNLHVFGRRAARSMRLKSRDCTNLKRSNENSHWCNVNTIH